MADWQRDLRGGATRPRATSAPRPSGAVHHREVAERDERIAELRAELDAARAARVASPSPKRAAASPGDDAARQVLLELRSRITAVEESEAAEASAAVQARLSETRAVEEARVSSEMAAEARVAQTARVRADARDAPELPTGARAELTQETAAPLLRVRTEHFEIGSPRTPAAGEEPSQNAILIAAIEKLTESVTDVSARQKQAELQGNRNAGRLEDFLNDGLSLMRDEMQALQARQRFLDAQHEEMRDALADSLRAAENEQRSEERLAWFSPQEPRTQRSEEQQIPAPRGQRSEEQQAREDTPRRSGEQPLRGQRSDEQQARDDTPRRTRRSEEEEQQSSAPRGRRSEEQPARDGTPRRSWEPPAQNASPASGRSEEPPGESDAVRALGAGLRKLADALEATHSARPASATLYPAEARALSSVTIPWDKLSTGPCVERLHVARQVVGDIISACAAVMPSTSDIDEGDEVPRNSRGVEIAMHWSESALEEAQDYARAFRDGTKLQGLPDLPRFSKDETSLDGIIFNKLAGKLTSGLQREVSGPVASQAGSKGKNFELPTFGSSSLACTRGVMYLLYRTAMPMSEPDEREMLSMLEKPTPPKRASQTVFALQDFTELVLLAARCGIEVPKYSFLHTPVRNLLKLAEGLEQDEQGDDLREERRKLEREYKVRSLTSGAEVRDQFVAYVGRLEDEVRRFVAQDGVADDGERLPRGRARRTRGARREAAAQAQQAAQTSAPKDGIAGLPKGIRVEGTSWYVEGLPALLTKAQRMREGENRVWGIRALASKAPKGEKLCAAFETGAGLPSREQLPRSPQQERQHTILRPVFHMRRDWAPARGLREARRWQAQGPGRR